MRADYNSHFRPVSVLLNGRFDLLNIPFYALPSDIDRTVRVNLAQFDLLNGGYLKTSFFRVDVMTCRHRYQTIKGLSQGSI